MALLRICVVCYRTRKWGPRFVLQKFVVVYNTTAQTRVEFINQKCINTIYRMPCDKNDCFLINSSLSKHTRHARLSRNTCVLERCLIITATTTTYAWYGFESNTESVGHATVLYVFRYFFK